MKWWKILFALWLVLMLANYWFLFSKTQDVKPLDKPLITTPVSLFNKQETILQSPTATKFRVATFNLWNYQSDWKTRFQLFSQTVSDEDIDIIAFQELRVDQLDLSANQFEYMKSLLSQYPHQSFAPASHINSNIQEGMAIFSKKPIVATSTKSLSLFPQDTDSNQRVVLQATIEVAPSLLLNAFAAHMSYADVTQCRHFLEMLQFVESFPKDVPQLILGDLNIYIDFEYPLHLFTGVPIDASSRCLAVWKERTNYLELIEESWWPHKRQFRDVWKTLHPNENGFTFLSNTPGLDSCRPDRILIGSNEVKEVDIRIIDTKKQKVQMSDHHGLVADFQWEGH